MYKRTTDIYNRESYDVVWLNNSLKQKTQMKKSK